MSEETYFTAREAAVYLRTSPSTLAKRRLVGNGPKFCRVGRAIRYRKADLDAFMAATASMSTSDRTSVQLPQKLMGAKNG